MCWRTGSRYIWPIRTNIKASGRNIKWPRKCLSVLRFAEKRDLCPSLIPFRSSAAPTRIPRALSRSWKRGGVGKLTSMKQEVFDRGVVILSFDIEQMWGHSDYLIDAEFRERYPGAFDAHDCLLDRLCAAHIRATWFLVGGLTLSGSEGARDRRMAGLPGDWTSTVPAGSEMTAPLWYRRSFVERLKAMKPRQEIGLHGGLTHLIWTDPRVTRDVAERELAEGLRALNEVGVYPCSFSHPREQEQYYDLLPLHG